MQKIARSRTHLRLHQFRMLRKVGGDSGIHNLEHDAVLSAEDVDRRAPAQEVQHHLRGHFRRIRADAFGGDPVIARKHEHRRILELRGRGALNASDLQSQRFQTSQRAGRLGLAVNPMLEFGGPFVAERWDVPNGHSVNRCGS